MSMYIRKLFKVGNISNRENWLKKTLKNIPMNQSILDAGAGELRYKKFCTHLKYTSQDFGEYSGDFQEGLQNKDWDNSKIDIKSDIINIPVENNSFDNIMCIEVLEHLPEPIKAIKEFSRILKKNGKLIITAPICSLTHMAPYYFYNGYSKYWYKKFLQDNGFEILEIKLNGNYFEYLIQELKRVKEIAKKYSKINIFFKLILYFLLIPFLFLLKYFSKSSKNSEELLCFGVQVLAKKI